MMFFRIQTDVERYRVLTFLVDFHRNVQVQYQDAVQGQVTWKARLSSDDDYLR